MITMRTSLRLSTLLLLATACATAPPPAPGPAPQRPDAAAFEPISGAVAGPEAPTVRVGLLTDEASVEFPRIRGGYIVVAEEGAFRTHRGFSARAPLAGATVRHGVQVGAISDASSAAAMKERIEREQGADVTIVFDAATGFNRVIAGSFASPEEARPFREELVAAGWPSESMIVARPSVSDFQRRIAVMDDEGFQRVFDGSSLLVFPAAEETVRIGGSPYRGAARLFINSRGLFNLINELNLEHYVQGVIPNEMGPRIYDELEALKAQALAARTYVVRRMGDYRSEGYDICPTPACQVYRGFATEHELTNRAVAETAGRVITHQGEPIDALYSATCGGHTSDVGVMFPGRNEPYLRSASCVELELGTLGGVGEGPLMNGIELRSRLFQLVSGHQPSGSQWAAGDLAAAMTAAMRVAGVNRAAGAPQSSRRRDVYRWLFDVWELAGPARHLLLTEDVHYLLPSRDVDAPETRTAAFLIKYEFLPFQHVDRVDLDAAIPRDEFLGILYSWLLHLERVEESRGRIRSLSASALEWKTDAGVQSRSLDGRQTAFRLIGERAQEMRAVPVLAGDRTTVVTSGGRVRAVLVEANYDGAAFDRTSAFSGWVRSHREDELVRAISRRNPIRDLEDLVISGRDEAGRITELVVHADGRSIPLRGLPIRWSLDTPDNLFTMHRSVDPDGVDRWTFYGKGWGHGVGMCQVGAFGMAFRGHSAEQIIRNYYTDVEIRSLTP